MTLERAATRNLTMCRRGDDEAQLKQNDPHPDPLPCDGRGNPDI